MIAKPLYIVDRSLAREEYERLYRQGLTRQWLRNLFGRPSRLLDLKDVSRHGKAHDSSHAGVQTVAIEQIRGSEGRSADFDAMFRPLKLHGQDRWAAIADCRDRGSSLPAVDLVQVEDAYFVRDGHNRVSVARMRGQLEIEANVTVWHNAQLPEPSRNRPDRTSGSQLPEAVARVWDGAVAKFRTAGSEQIGSMQASDSSRS